MALVLTPLSCLVAKKRSIRFPDFSPNLQIFAFFNEIPRQVFNGKIANSSTWPTNFFELTFIFGSLNKNDCIGNEQLQLQELEKRVELTWLRFWKQYSSKTRLEWPNLLQESQASWLENILWVSFSAEESHNACCHSIFAPALSKVDVNCRFCAWLSTFLNLF